MIVRPENFGAVYGQVSNEQKALNLQALNEAAAQGGQVTLAGKLYLANAVECFADLWQTGVSLCGESMLESGLWYQSTRPIDTFVSLRGTSYFRMENLTISGGNAARFGLFCGRDESLQTAGKHIFHNVRAVDCRAASFLNHGSEENAHFKCQYQRSPIGAIITGHEVRSDIAERNAQPVEWDSPWIWSTSHNFYDCAFGDGNYASRCGLLVARSVVYLFGGIIQAKRDEAEAYVILDGTQQMAHFAGVHLDAGLCDIGFRIGHYAPATVYYESRLSMVGCHISINSDTGTRFIQARNLTSSVIGPMSVSGGIPGNQAIIELESASCRNVEFINCRYQNGDPIPVAWI